MSSSLHSNITSSAFDMENAFSTMNIYNYTSASSGSTSFNSSEDSRDDMIPPTSSLFYNNPYLKDVWKWISDKRTKNEAKNNKTKHENGKSVKKRQSQSLKSKSQ
ncbi:hypothetical protein Tco_1079314 [Tanacetum coccineum]|uniref:Uncharacterized protein n=1 Tax=Tanacetum coccineum TaxID=301880 RepID=A0ABQ5HSD5_9ASTR